MLKQVCTQLGSMAMYRFAISCLSSDAATRLSAELRALLNNDDNPLLVNVRSQHCCSHVCSASTWIGSAA